MFEVFGFLPYYLARMRPALQGRGFYIGDYSYSLGVRFSIKVWGSIKAWGFRGLGLRLLQGQLEGF